jgi:hypothetical protein
MQGIRPIALPIAGLLLAVLHGSSVQAEIRVQGHANDVRVEARDATVAEILTALGERFAVRFRGTTGSRGVTATFEGPLRRVLTRVLDGYDFVIATHDGGLDVIVMSARSQSATPPATPAVVNRRRED